MRTNEYENMGISQRRDFSARSGTDIIVISKLLKRHSKAKRRAPSYSQALRQIKGVVQRIVRWRLRSGCQRVRGGRLDVKADLVHCNGCSLVRGIIKVTYFLLTFLNPTILSCGCPILW